MGPAGGQIQRAQSAGNLNQPAPPQSTSPLSSSGVSVGVGNSASNQSQLPWPRMTPSDVQKYTKVFIEVDSDRDGKITGEQARNLFLSWRLPRGKSSSIFRLIFWHFSFLHISDLVDLKAVVFDSLVFLLYSIVMVGKVEPHTCCS